MSNKSSPHGGFISEGTVSHGTLRTQDLLRAFADEYERVLPFNSLARVMEARQIADAIDSNHENDNEYASAAVTELHDALNEIASREGLYFGNTEGDGSDFGYWAVENENDE